jgi:hypothetical protein
VGTRSEFGLCGVGHRYTVILQASGSDMTDSGIFVAGDSGTVGHENVKGSEPNFHRPSVTAQGVKHLEDQDGEELRSAIR